MGVFVLGMQGKMKDYMKTVEMGEIGSCFGEDLYADLCRRIEDEGRGWNPHDIREFLVELCRDRLPERGYTIEAEKSEIFGLDFNPLACEVTLVPKDERFSKWTRADDKMLSSAIWHCSFSISNGKSSDIKCDTTEWLRTLKLRLSGKSAMMAGVLLEILKDHAKMKVNGARVAILGEDVLSSIEKALDMNEGKD